jgi:hypothetical protein
MTRFEPTIIVNRLVVKRNTLVAYDQNFHRGVNVVRGENASGKSTVLNFIYFGLGGELSHWSTAALLCTSVFLECQLNQIVVTLRRDVSNTPGQPMEMCLGKYDEAIVAPIEKWVRYPYRSSSSRESFSQSIFRLLSLPEVNNESTGNITIHQLLRLLYADQLSPVDDLFKFEQFDPPSIRDAVSRLLCGAYESKLYENELKLKSLSKQYEEAASRLSSLFAVVGKTEHSTSFEWIQAAISNAETEKQELNDQIAATEKQLFASSDADHVSIKAQETAYEEVKKLQLQIADLRHSHDQKPSLPGLSTS